LIPEELAEVDCPWQYPDEETVLRGLLSAGPAARAMQASGEAAVRDALLQALEPFKSPSGQYRLKNKYRYLIAKAG
jgi:hypothetical protein